MKKIPTISVCMSMYNAAHYIEDCLDSILQQTFDNFEVIIVDDGSTDNGCELVEAYADPRIVLIKSVHDFIGSLNIALDNAKGKYIARMDADDIMLSGRLKEEFEYLENHPNVAAVAGYGNLIGDRQEKCCAYGGMLDVTLEDLLSGNVVVNSTSMIRTSDIGGLRYARDFIYAEDYNFWVDMLAKGLHIHVLPSVLLDYRVSETQVTNLHYKEMMEKTEAVKQKICGMLYSDFSDCHLIEKLANVNDGIVPVSNNKLTVIMPFLNERDEVGNTLRSIRETAGNEVDIIVINDNSDDGYDYEREIKGYDVSYICNSRRLGVAACRDLGVELCRTPYFLLLDAHMRFYDNQWAECLVQLLGEDDRVLLCCQTRFLGKNENGKVYVRNDSPDSFGAVTEFNTNSYWPDIHWSLHDSSPDSSVEPIANVLGAGYAASRRYWKYLHGLHGLRKFGCDEALISFKVWREGGRCLLVKDVVVGHIYRDESPYKHYSIEEVSNYLLVSYVVFSQSWYCRSLAVALRLDREMFERAMRLLNFHKEKVVGYSRYMQSVYTLQFEEVLQIHRNILLSAGRNIYDCGQYECIDGFLEQKEATGVGLFYGKAGLLLWHALYAKWKGVAMDGQYLQSFLDEVGSCIDTEVTSWNFSHGLAGIGWVLVYLGRYGMIEKCPEEILAKIDRCLQNVDMENAGNGRFDTGTGGILAYFVLRKIIGGYRLGDVSAAKLNAVATEILDNENADIPSTYYAFFWLDLQKRGAEAEPYMPRIGEWLMQAQILPKNRKYWSPCLYGGCIGAVARLMESEVFAKLYFG